MTPAHWLWIFRVAVIADLAAIYFQWEEVRLISKPLIVLPLLIYFTTSVKDVPGVSGFFKSALFFSLAGDIALLFEDRNPIFFMAGLGCFLLAHVLYIAAFAGIRKMQMRYPHQAAIPARPWWIAGVLIYLGVLLFVLLPYLGELKVPVIIYSVVLCVMLLTVVHAFRKLYAVPGIICLLGAIFFVLSDSVLAFNKFYAGFAYSGLLIMLTYACAQYCLVTGSTRLLRSPQTANFAVHINT